MNAYQCWERERDSLRLSLKAQSDMSGVTYAIRHALMQTEQNALAEQTDDVLRQQMGVLFGVVKNAAALLEAPLTTTTWVAQSRQGEKRDKGKLTLTSLAALFITACGLLCYFKGQTLGWVAALAALITGGAALVRERKAAKARAAKEKDTIKVTLQPDVDKLLATLDGQMRTIDRCANDFAYLNESLRGDSHQNGGAMVNHVSTLLEALYECDDEGRAPAREAVNEMLDDMGLKALDYSDESRKLFTALPSKNETRTLCPAIVSAEDYRLLKRGTAAVKMDAA